MGGGEGAVREGGARRVGAASQLGFASAPGGHTPPRQGHSIFLKTCCNLSTMPRPDLLALTPDDLAGFANRGLVKRAQKDLESGGLSAQWEEREDGTIRAEWSDGVTSTLPGGQTLKAAGCTCGAFELCRHVLRTVLAWQVRQAEAATGGAVAVAEAWDPGRIDDARLESQCPKAVRDRAGALWKGGVLAELLRAVKPSASFHHPGHTVRFLVPDDLRYVQCSCAEPAPCVHAVLAVWAFRRLAPDAPSGIVSEGPLDAPVPPPLLSAVEGCVDSLLSEGLAALSPAWRDRVRRVAAECQAATLTWPAQILEEVAEDFERYTARDAVFTPVGTLERIGELLLRVDAIRAGVAPVPQAFVRGLKSDRDSDLGAGRFVGLGGTVAEGRSGDTLTVFLQDADSGHTMTLRREFAVDREAGTPVKSYAQLAQSAAVKDASLAMLAGGQLITQGGKRTASGRLVVGRARAVVNPQNYLWEQQLKAPVLTEDFAEVEARLRLLPPASFRPRRAGADFHVCPLVEVEHAAFDPASNAVVATVRDPSGRAARLVHPWSGRGEAGAEALLATLRTEGRPLFVAGHVQAAHGALVIRPTALVVGGEGKARRCVLPWFDPGQKSAKGEHRSFEVVTAQRSANDYAGAAELAAELLLHGLRRTEERGWQGWQGRITEIEERGLHKIAGVLRTVRDRGDEPGGARVLLKVLALARDAGLRVG